MLILNILLIIIWIAAFTLLAVLIYKGFKPLSTIVHIFLYEVAVWGTYDSILRVFADSSLLEIMHNVTYNFWSICKGFNTNYGNALPRFQEISNAELFKYSLAAFLLSGMVCIFSVAVLGFIGADTETGWGRKILTIIQAFFVPIIFILIMQLVILILGGMVAIVVLFPLFIVLAILFLMNMS